MRLQRFCRADLPAQPWKNGGGVTREVVCLPAGSDTAHFDWRVSIAHIERSGPFSAFTGVDRVITLLEGPGVMLQSTCGSITHRLDTPLMPFAFAGEAEVQADLLSSDCHDFNVMTRRAACAAKVQVLHGATILRPATQGLLFAVQGRWRAQSQTIMTGEGLWWCEAPIAWSLNPESENAALIAVLIDFPA